MTSKSVNRPTNVKQKEEDINQKLQLYGIFTGKSLMDSSSIGGAMPRRNVQLVSCWPTSDIITLQRSPMAKFLR